MPSIKEDISWFLSKNAHDFSTPPQKISYYTYLSFYDASLLKNTIELAESVTKMGKNID